MNDPKISVIVPVYNVEKYLRRCIDSILSQIFTDFEVLLIDDGSTDYSGKICDEYTKKDERVRVFHNENKGVSATREFGVKQSNGIYIQFIDSDDWINKRMFLEMYSIAVNSNADIVGCCFYEILPDKETYIKTFYADKDDFAKDIIKSNWGVLWKLLHKRSLYQSGNIHFPKDIDGGEDYVVCVSLILEAKTVCCINEGFYFYNRCNEKSLMHSMTLRKVEFQLSATRIVEKIITKKGLNDYYKSELDIRKFSAKYPLIRIRPFYWYSVFPESNYLYKMSNISIKVKILMSVVILIRSVLKNY